MKIRLWKCKHASCHDL